ncbi:MAG: WD40 repeat domain-containing protein, partial [Calditrichaeota bacterium]|nr:WD40 repeat domain-containing protein [Calditrichota bacterium]
THRAAVQKALFSPDGQQLLSASSDGFARLWQLDGTLVLKLRHEDGVNWATFSPDGRHILTAADDARVYL